MFHRSIVEYAKNYASKGYALTQLRPGKKCAVYPSWTDYSFSPEGFSHDDNIGITARALPIKGLLADREVAQ